MDIWNTLAAIPWIGPFLPYLGALVTIGGAVAMLLPPPKDTSKGWYRTLYSAVNWCALNKFHATNATAPIAKVLALVAVLGLVGLSACTKDPNGNLVLTPAGSKAFTLACNVDGVVQPVAATVATAAGYGTVVGIDAALVHPAVVAACAKLGGAPIAIAEPAPAK